MSGNTSDPKFVECLPKTTRDFYLNAHARTEFDAYMDACIAALPEDFETTSWNRTNRYPTANDTAQPPPGSDDNPVAPGIPLFVDDEDDSGDAESPCPRWEQQQTSPCDRSEPQQSSPATAEPASTSTEQILAPPAPADSNDDIQKIVVSLVIGSVGASHAHAISSCLL